MAKFLEVIELRSRVESAIPITERSNNNKGVYGKLLAQFLTILSGGFQFCHLGWWDCGVNVGEQLGESSRMFALTVFGWESITQDNLNLDSCVATRYGQQERARRGYNTSHLRGRAFASSVFCATADFIRLSSSNALRKMDFLKSSLPPSFLFCREKSKKQSTTIFLGV